MCYLFVQLLRHPLPAFTHGTWSGYWAATDTVVAVAISFAPLAADYTRHSRSARAAFAGALAGYSVTQVLCYVIGLLALVTVAHGNPDDIFGAFIALPLGSLGFAILAARELDQSFADVYSTAVSMQNLRPLWDRRVLAGVITALTTAGALWLNIADYENFLTLLGSVFVPMSAVLITDYFVVPRREPALGPVGRGPVPLADAAALGGGLRRLPAHQPRLRVLVGLGLDLVRPATSGSPRPAGCPPRSCPSPSPPRSPCAAGWLARRARDLAPPPAASLVNIVGGSDCRFPPAPRTDRELLGWNLPPTMPAAPMRTSSASRWKLRTRRLAAARGGPPLCWRR